MPIVEDDTPTTPETLEQLELQRKQWIQQALLNLNGPGTTPKVDVKRAPPSRTSPVKARRMKESARVAQNLLRTTRPRKF